MARLVPRNLWLALALLVLLHGTSALKPRRPLHHPQLEVDVRERRQGCEEAMAAQRGVCRSSGIEFENCVLRCMSAECYEQQYGQDPLEEGEVDVYRGRRYKVCLIRQIMEQRAAEVGMTLEQRRVPGYRRI